MIYTIYLVNDNNEITETISLDVINNFGEEYSSSVAQNTVETGYVISDSVSISNPRFSISGVITDSKFRVKNHLIYYDGVNFVKGNNVESEANQQTEDDDYAQAVKDRLLKLWENTEIFGILESRKMSNLEGLVGSQVRSIFPCVLTSLSFTSSDTSNAFYPNLSIERIRYTTVAVTEVTNPIAELIPKYIEDQLAKSKTESTAGTSELADAKAQAKALLGDTSNSSTPKAEIKSNLENLSLRAQNEATEELLAYGNRKGVETKRTQEITEQLKAVGNNHNEWIRQQSEKNFRRLADHQGDKDATYTPH